MSDISTSEKTNLIKDIKLRAVFNILIGLGLIACLVTASLIFRNHQIYGLAQGVTMGALGFVGTIIGSEIFLIQNIGKI